MFQLSEDQKFSPYNIAMGRKRGKAMLTSYGAGVMKGRPSTLRFEVHLWTWMPMTLVVWPHSGYGYHQENQDAHWLWRYVVLNLPIFYF